MIHRDDVKIENIGTYVHIITPVLVWGILVSTMITSLRAQEEDLSKNIFGVW